MATSYSGRASVTTTYSGRPSIANEGGWNARTSITRFASYLCDRLGNQICDVSGNPIIVYDVNGSINLGGTVWNGRIIP